jgi:hypothetical protein
VFLFSPGDVLHYFAFGWRDVYIDVFGFDLKRNVTERFRSLEEEGKRTFAKWKKQEREESGGKGLKAFLVYLWNVRSVSEFDRLP